MEATQIILANTPAAEVIRLVKQAVQNSPTKVSFFSIRYYTNDHDETSHYSINLGSKYEYAKIRDIEFLRTFNPLDEKYQDSKTGKYIWKSAMIELFKAKEELIKAFETPNKARSQGQTDAYEPIIGNALKIHKETGNLMIYGYLKSKRVLIPGEYDTVNSAPLTIAKNEIRKLLRTGKFRMFSINGYNELKANGQTLAVYFTPKASII